MWSVKDHDAAAGGDVGHAGLYDGHGLRADQRRPRSLGIDRATGAVRWEKELPGPTWQSPVVVDDVLIEGDCAGVLHAYDVSDTPGRAARAVVGRARRLHRVDARGVERAASTSAPAAGRFFAIGDR